MSTNVRWEAKQPVVGHFQNTADVGRLLLVQKQRGRRRVRVDPVLALQKPERDQRIQEISRRPGVQAQASADVVRRAGVFRNLGEQFHFDGAQ